MDLNKNTPESARQFLPALYSMTRLSACCPTGARVRPPTSLSTMPQPEDFRRQTDRRSLCIYLMLLNRETSWCHARLDTWKWSYAAPIDTIITSNIMSRYGGDNVFQRLPDKNGNSLLFDSCVCSSSSRLITDNSLVSSAVSAPTSPSTIGESQRCNHTEFAVRTITIRYVLTNLYPNISRLSASLLQRVLVHLAQSNMRDISHRFLMCNTRDWQQDLVTYRTQLFLPQSLVSTDHWTLMGPSYNEFFWFSEQWTDSLK